MTTKEKTTSVYSIIGFVCSILVFVFLPISIVGLIFSWVGLKETSKGKMKGRGFAIAGLILGIWGTITFIWAVAIPYMQFLLN